MRKNRWKLKRYAKMLSIVILLSFLKFPVYGEPLTELPQNSSESGTRLYSDSEVDRLIDEISEAALEAIEQASAEAARAAALAALEREALLLQAKALALREAQRWQLEAEAARRNGRKNAVIAGLVCFLGGLAVGVGGTLIIGGR